MFMLTNFEGTEIDVQKATKVIKNNQGEFERSNVNFLKFRFRKGMGWVNRLLDELESRGIVSSLGEDGKRKVIN